MKPNSGNLGEDKRGQHKIKKTKIVFARLSFLSRNKGFQGLLKAIRKKKVLQYFKGREEMKHPNYFDPELT